MQTILFIIPRLHYGGAAKQLSLLAAGLSRESFAVRVLVLDDSAPWVESLRAAGIAVEVLGWTRPFDVRPFLMLRRLLRSIKPDVVHVWGAAALRAVVLSGSWSPNRLLVSAALPPMGTPARVDRWLLRRVQGIIALGAADAERYRRLGIESKRITLAAPAMPVPTDAVEPADLPGIGPADRVLLGVGPIEPHKGFRQAVWAFDILRHLYEDVHFVVVGEGSDRPRVEQFARSIDALDRVHFLGRVAETARLLRRADLAWVPSLRCGGIRAALEAMAAGRAVIAGRCAELAEIIVDGETGFLVEPNDKAAFARQTRFLLDDPARRERCGAAGRQRVREHFSVLRLVEACARRYVGDTIPG